MPQQRPQSAKPASRGFNVDDSDSQQGPLLQGGSVASPIRDVRLNLSDNEHFYKSPPARMAQRPTSAPPARAAVPGTVLTSPVTAAGAKIGIRFRFPTLLGPLVM
jgi:hypothetical protein